MTLDQFALFYLVLGAGVALLRSAEHAAAARAVCREAMEDGEPYSGSVRLGMIVSVLGMFVVVCLAWPYFVADRAMRDVPVYGEDDEGDDEEPAP